MLYGNKKARVPLYDFHCRACGHEFEALVRGSDQPTCSSCKGTDLEKRLSLFAVNSEATRQSALQSGRRHIRKEQRDRQIADREAIEHHRYNYHVLDKEEISAEALDSLKNELVALEKEVIENLSAILVRDCEDGKAQQSSGTLFEAAEEPRLVLGIKAKRMNQICTDQSAFKIVECRRSHAFLQGCRCRRSR